MATRCRIGILNNATEEGGNGLVDSIYIHWDGYPERIRKILKKFYTTELDVRNLILKGYQSSLNEDGTITPFTANDGELFQTHQWEEKYPWPFNGQEFEYCFLPKDNKWMYRKTGKGWTEL